METIRSHATKKHAGELKWQEINKEAFFQDEAPLFAPPERWEEEIEQRKAQMEAAAHELQQEQMAIRGRQLQIMQERVSLNRRRVTVQEQRLAREHQRVSIMEQQARVTHTRGQEFPETVTPEEPTEQDQRIMERLEQETLDMGYDY